VKNQGNIFKMRRLNQSATRVVHRRRQMSGVVEVRKAPVIVAYR